MFVYTIRSEKEPDRFYVGISDDPHKRLDEHNAGKSVHTNRFRPWTLVSTHWFADSSKARSFERYLKTGSGRSFAARHF